MTGWDREYLAHKEEYLKLFDSVMQKEQEKNVEFLEKSLTKITGRKYAVACGNGTDALHFALISLGIGPGDEVLTTNFSWISSASCVSMTGATPVFCDIDLNSYHMSMESINKMWSPKVKAIVYPHLFGNMSDMTEILEFCKGANLPFIEDACQALGSSLNDVKAGSIGDVSCLSFNANKVVAGIAGGGAVLTDDKDKAELFKKLRKHGDNETLGYNSKMLTFNAEFIDFRLQKMEEWQSKRQEIAKKYDEGLKDYVTIQPTTNGLNHNYHKYVVRFQNKELRDKVKERLNATVHYPKPLSENSMYESIDHRKDDCKNAKRVSDTILTLPIHPYLTDIEIGTVINTIQILCDLDETKFVEKMKRILGDDIVDKSLIDKEVQPVYEHIVEKIYLMPEYAHDIPKFKDKPKEQLRIAFNKFYHKL